MLPPRLNAGQFPDHADPRHILMTTDAVGGVWRYSADLARALNAEGIGVLLVCPGPTPNAAQRAEIAALPETKLIPLEAPLDWLAGGKSELGEIGALLEELAAINEVDLLHLNLPSQASDLRTHLPVVVASHSCLVTWWQAMRQEPLPEHWRWHLNYNRQGFAAADAVIAPSASHAEAQQRAYGAVPRLYVVPNAVRSVENSPDFSFATAASADAPYVFAAARWWDEAKNGTILDEVAALTAWPIRAAGACSANGQSFTFRHVLTESELSSQATRGLMQEAAIFVSPSRYEPFGLAALEAAHAGIPLVLADIPTYRELWDDAALFADPLSAKAFAAAITELAEKDSLRKAFADKARERAQRYTPKRQVQALLSVYHAATKTKSAAQQSVAVPVMEQKKGIEASIPLSLTE